MQGGFIMANKSKLLLSLLKGVIISVAFSLISVLILSMLSSIFSFGEKVIVPINTAIKAVAVALGVLFSVSDGKGLIKGLIYGVIIVILNYLLFSIIGGSFTFTVRILWELLLGIAVGGISGIIAVNLKKKG